MAGGDLRRRARAGLASAVYFTVRQLGMATAVAALGALALSRHPVAGCRLGAASAAVLLLLGLVMVLRTQPDATSILGHRRGHESGQRSDQRRERGWAPRGLRGEG